MTAVAGHQALVGSLDLLLTSPSGQRYVAHEVEYALGANDIGYVITLTGDKPSLPVIGTTLRIS
jgi:hypothetical protein